MLKESRITKSKPQTLDGDLVMFSKEDHEFTEQEVDKLMIFFRKHHSDLRPTFVVYCTNSAFLEHVITHSTEYFKLLVLG